MFIYVSIYIYIYIYIYYSWVLICANTIWLYLLSNIIAAYYYYYSLQVLERALAGGLSLYSERQKVCSGLQDSSRSQKCCSLDGLDSFSDFPFFLSFNQSFETFKVHRPRLESSSSSPCLIMFYFSNNLQVFADHFALC